jgi:hypothetical protein
VLVAVTAIKNITFSNSGGAIASCAVAPALPTGLSIDSATCTISGTPTELRASTLYTVTATNTIGQSAIATVDLEILLADSVCLCKGDIGCLINPISSCTSYPGHADFITTTDSQSFYDWMLPNIDDDGALRSAFLAKTDGSGV